MPDGEVLDHAAKFRLEIFPVPFEFVGETVVDCAGF